MLEFKKLFSRCKIPFLRPKTLTFFVVLLFSLISFKLHNILFSSIQIFEFDTVYFANMVIGTLEDGLPDFNNIYANSIWKCSLESINFCLDNKELVVQNDLFPIDYSSGYLMVFATAFISKILLIFNQLNLISPPESILSTIINSFSIYICFIYLIGLISIVVSINYLNQKNSIYFSERLILIFSFLLVPFSGVPHVTDRMVGELPSVIYISAAFIIFGASTTSLLRLERRKKYRLLDDSTIYHQKFRNVFLVSFILLILSTEAKSSVLPTAITILASQLLLVFQSKFLGKAEFTNILRNAIQNSRNFFNYVLILLIGIFPLMISNKIIPSLFYAIFRKDLFTRFIQKSKEFYEFQSNAGRGWGGETITSFRNLRNNIAAYPHGNLVVILSLIIILIAFFILLNYFFRIIGNPSRRRNFDVYLDSTIISACNLLIFISSYSYSIIYRFPYLRNVFISLAITLLIPINLVLILGQYRRKNIKYEYL